MRRLFWASMVAGLLVVASRASAQTVTVEPQGMRGLGDPAAIPPNGPPPPVSSPPPSSPPVSSPPAGTVAPLTPPPPPAPPPGYGGAPNAWGAPNGYGYGYGYPAAGYSYSAYGYGTPYVDPSVYLNYDSAKKSEAIALLLEFVFPGVGSLYADHGAGALMTWGIMAAGMGIAMWSMDKATTQSNADPYTYRQPDWTMFYVGFGVAVAGRIFGFIDSFTSVGDYNKLLAKRMGLPPSMALAPVPMRMGNGGAVAWGPGLTLKF